MAGVLLVAVVVLVGVVGCWLSVMLGHPASLMTPSEERHWALLLLLAARLSFLPPALGCTRPVVLAANYCTFLL